MIDVLAIVQARFSSTRLPGKVLKPILGKPMIMHQMRRLNKCGFIESLIVATSTHPTDDALSALLGSNNVACFRGKLDDVLDRFYQAAQLYKPGHVVRITGDCPVIDPAIVDQVLGIHLNEGNDYTTNTLEPSFPDGLDVEVFTYAALYSAWKTAQLPSEREHVTSYIRNHPELFQLRNVLNKIDLSHFRWTVDEAEDFNLICEFYKELYQDNPDFSMGDILDLLKARPELNHWNNRFKRNEGFEKSLLKDNQHTQKR